MDFGIPGLKQQTNKQFEVRKMLERKKSLFVCFFFVKRYALFIIAKLLHIILKEPQIFLLLF